MSYIPNTDKDREEMLREIDISSIENLFKDIPQEVKIKEALKLPSPLPEAELLKHLRDLSERNADVDHYASFLGGGAYNHFMPSAVKHIISRAEFYTAYTPYQGEASQGILQAIYEYQTMICNLTGMDVANASMYDGGTALSEAALLASRFTGRKEIIISSTVHPEYRAVLKTYANGAGLNLIEIPYTEQGLTDREKVKKSISENSCALIIQQPNFFGCLEEVFELTDIIRSKNGLFIVSVDPISLGLLKPPSEYGADIVVGEGQSLGNQLSFGGPYLGIFACKKDFMRMMPGRIVGLTVDLEGRRGFALTLQTREQHIRRERATSNICTNEALAALAATVYLSLIGKSGLKKVAELCLQKANYLKSKLSELNGFSISFSAPTVKEFVVKLPMPSIELNKKLLEEKIIGGLDLEKFYPELKNHMLFCATEMILKEDIDRLVSALR